MLRREAARTPELRRSLSNVKEHGT